MRNFEKDCANAEAKAVHRYGAFAHMTMKIFTYTEKARQAREKNLTLQARKYLKLALDLLA